MLLTYLENRPSISKRKLRTLIALDPAQLTTLRRSTLTYLPSVLLLAITKTRLAADADKHLTGQT